MMRKLRVIGYRFILRHYRVQAEMARRANLCGEGKKRVYSGKFALSSVVFCGNCGNLYRRIKWNNRGVKSTVWRCVSRVDKDVASCTGRTLRENELQRAIVNAVNDILNRKDAVIAVLEKNVSDTLNNGASSRIADIDQELDKLQHELLAENVDKAAVQEIGNTILALREEKQTLMEKIARNRKAQDRVTEMVKYLNEQDRIINEYSEALVRRLIERISVYDDRVVVKFKSGLETAVWM